MTYSAREIVNNPRSVFDNKYGAGDAIQLINKRTGDAVHTYYICCYGSYNGNPDFKVSYHSNNAVDASFTALCSGYVNNDNYEFKFFKMR